MLTRKIGAPHQPELAIGAIVDGEPPEIVINQDVAKIFGLDRDRIERLAALEHLELERRRKLYLSGRDPLPLAGTVTVLVDDGIATGATARAAIAALRHRGAAMVIFAVPVAPSQTARQMRNSVDELVCLETPTPFFSVGEHYQSFEQVEDEEVIALLNAYREPRRARSTLAAHGRN
jgi:putative phosphoribosyl transferase